MQVGSVTGEAEDACRRADRMSTEAEDAVDRIESRLADLERHLTGEGAEALRQAVEQQTAAGQQSEQLTGMATEARQLASRLLLNATVC